MIIQNGIPPQHRTLAAALYWDAFGAKLGRVMGPRDTALRFISRVLDPDHGICAVDNNGALLGVAGFKTINGALVGGTFTDLSAVYGIVGATWRAALLSLLERDTENERFLMDGIFVAPKARACGIGTALLDAVCDEAATRGYAEVRLDVIDTNPRAKALYKREGFVEIDTQQLGPLRWVFGFASATTMVRTLP